MRKYDLVVIGGGPGGYVAAIRAAHLGLSVALVEKEPKLGGTCLLRGCIPTKSLLHSADLLRDLQGAKAHGIIAGEVGFDFTAVQKKRKKVITKNAAGVAYLMKQNGIEVVRGVGRLTSPTTVEVTTSDTTVELTGKNLILATGSVPKPLPALPIDGKQVLTSTELLEVEQPPASLLIVGAGAVGVEFASIFNRFGSRCTLVEMTSRVLPLEDEEVSLEVQRLLEKRGVQIHTDTRVDSVETREQSVVVTLSGARTEEVTTVLNAAGRAPFTEGLGLREVGIDLDDRGFVPVDGFMQTSKPNLYAVGDIVSSPQLAHVASAEGLLAVDHLTNRNVTPIDYGLVPTCTYSDPEVGSVGLTEQQAKEAGIEIKVGKFPFAALGKARVIGKTDGFVKLVAESKSARLLGAHIVGPQATDLIAEACLALQSKSTIHSLTQTIHAHPSLPEAIHEAAHGAIGRALHL